MTDTITPQAIDAYVFIESIRIENRHRKDLGDLQGLMDSIEDIGLLHPPTITEDSRLVAGQRRIEACRRLGWDNVPVRIAKNLDEAARLLRAERDENTERKDMLPSEKASLGEALHALHAAEAKERQGTRTDLGRQLRDAEDTKLGEPGSNANKTRTKVGDAIGMGGSTYGDLRQVYKLATDPDVEPEVRAIAQEGLDEMDRTGQIRPNAERVKARVRAKREAQEAKAAALAEPVEVKEDELDPSWIPPGRDSSPTAVQQRLKLIAYHAGRGLSSRQIAEVVDIGDVRVREVARKHNIPIPADAIVGRQRRIDSNRVARETVYALEGAAMSVQLVNADELDRSELTAWTESLTASIRTLNRFLKQLKELAS
jgi:ParB-like chromosome segregation protein Spo0J